MESQPPPQKWGRAPSPIFGPFLLWPNGWIQQSATWHGGSPQSRGLCVRWGLGTQLPSPKRGGAAAQILGPCVLWPNGWMDQDGTWHGGRPWSRPHGARWGHIYPPKKGAPQFSAHLHCGQTAGCINLTLGMEVGLSPGEFVSDEDPAPCPKRGRAPNF